MQRKITVNIFIRSLLFNLSMILITVIVGSVGFLFCFFSKRIAQKVSYIWGKSFLIALKLICNLDHKIEGLENLPEGSCIIASKHESAWDTVFFLDFLKNPAYIFKKSLLYLPIVGQYLYTSHMIYIDRSKGSKSIKKIIEQAKIIKKQGRKIIIFPQGTRTAPKQQMRYKSGIYAICSNANLPVVPVVLNAGTYWAKGAFIKFPGTISVKLLPVMKDFSDKRKFLSDLENVIESEYLKML
jgi:1-acyl-sn-glycerol-3-phosphate acyltransferase